MSEIEDDGGPPAVRARGVSVTRGEAEVLHGIDLDVTRGSVVGLLGPSGSGKTTLLRSIVGVQEHVTGTLEVLGRPAGAPSLRRRVGYATQAASVYEDLTVEENLRYFARLLGADAAAVARTLDRVGLAGERGRLVRTLSGGQRGRVSLGVALVGSPDLLVLDEPTVGLDPVLREELWGLFGSLADGGTTLLVSSHVMDEAMRCDRLLLLRSGRLLRECTPAELLAETGAADAEQAFLTLIERTTAEGRVAS
ncbi:ABC-2 type transport system ATP-binding protein [Salana multivorans]|uniref:ABC-2 type transport system ATP-binding protein n=1 Tax=Salana multivorans TaxID=120377 RepID=A0A3N2DAI7_9MICO|nr:MAG: multidrug ABC transporter ATP-binding protein [Micrococcales bacterium 73-15]ROR96753.1 ABC-2 type transport system ATP-binding protein [Salana multivorans]